MATQPSDDDETHDQPLIEEPNTDDHAQRKRSRVLSHLDEDSGPTAAAINSTAETVVEREATPVDEHDSPAPEANRASNTTGPIKRRKLNVDIAEMVDQDETTRESTRTRSNSGSKDDSSTTTDEPEDDDVEEDEDEDEEEEEEQDDESDDTKLPPTRNHYLNLRQRELGIFPRPRERATCRAFHTNTIASRNLVQRMKVSHTLDAHNGCVNALAFNRIGTLLASASDDLQIILWDWAANQVAVAYESEHHSNVFQAKFVPYSDDCQIVSCARDGQVRLAELHPDGSLRCTKKIAQHLASAHKLAIDTITGTDIFSCGEDGVVYQIDLRENKANKLLTVNTESTNKLPLYSIDLNRNNQNEFVLAGMDPYIRVFDRRFIDTNAAKPLKSFCPDLLTKIEDRQRQPSVTSAVYNYNGTEILGSYNDEDIYLFDATHSDGADAIHRYRGHRNSNTVKSVNFYGQNSEYVISGSDCGHVFIWDKCSETCVWFDKGDEDGTVNVLEPHPHFPIIATSGLEHDVKIWQPLSSETVDLKRLKSLMRRNAREREHELHFASVLDTDTGGLLRLMRPVFRRIVRRANADEQPAGDDDEDDDDDNDDGDEDTEDARRRARHIYSFDCAPS